MRRTGSHAASPSPVASGAALAAAGALVAAIATLTAAGPDRPIDAAAELRVDAHCRLVDPVALEPLGELDDEPVRLARARCTADRGPLAGARLEADWTWAVERRAIGAGPGLWRADDATLTLSALDATLRREPDGGWIVGARGTVADASGRLAGWTGHRWVLVARIDGVDETDAPGH